MRTIFDGLVEEFRAWHLFEQQAGNSPRRDLRGPGEPGYSLGGYEAGGASGPGFSRPRSGTGEYGASGSGAPDPGASRYRGAGYDLGPRHGRGSARGGTPARRAPLAGDGLNGGRRISRGS